MIIVYLGLEIYKPKCMVYVLTIQIVTMSTTISSCFNFWKIKSLSYVILLGLLPMIRRFGSSSSIIRLMPDYEV